MLRNNRPNSSLEYLRPSPVRGQLEPQDPKTTKGWRYLQTTDTLDELKVLIPPNTASMYEQLLKLETLELAKKSVTWDRLLEIRHLKDRMIRKCQKLSKAPPARRIGHGDPFTFQTLVAPVDFRLKEMEKWFRQQQTRISSVGTQRPTGHAHKANTRNSYCCARCASNPQYRHHSKSKLSSFDNVTPIPAFTEEPEPMIPSPSPTPPKAISPEPLPHLLRSSMAMALMNQNYTTTTVTTTLQGETATRPEGTVSKIESTSHKLRHQRSCIKRSNTGDSVKTVSWADDRDLMERVGKFTNATKEAQEIGTSIYTFLDHDEWEDIRQAYVNHMDHLESLEEQVQNSLQRLRIESETLQQVCANIGQHKESLREVVGRFGQKQSDYRAKVQEVLSEADGLLSLYGTREPQENRNKFMPIIDEDSREEPVIE
ncbi:hypothetical protein F5876DRAFT_71492 [Lentinula aff. lateritia]|uniref:Uncharacterized protein n=1 Tax=Lentinula aff. lateritia TaxID=2804960 RepID=A0ACC1UG05_9AGAR|nr:hypothetical protein F5876DRAFT_71492 [Lentinula aff. lateritia]